tara:strand:+ start:2198 stop:3877 length:1680 start_codon:yes stop_codon:yes gene_type:complete
MIDSLKNNKLSVLDKRLKAFEKGYRQNLTLLNDDPDETSYILDGYFSTERIENLIYIRFSTSYKGKKEIFKTIAFSLLSAYARKSDPLDRLICQLSSSLPATTDFIKDSLKKDNISFLDATEIINTFLTESNLRCVLIIEEFLNLINIFDDFYQSFSNFIILQRNCMVVLSETKIKEAQRILLGELNLLFGNFEKVFLNNNAFLDNYFYLKSLLAPLDCSVFFISFFVNILDSNLMYYDFISRKIKKHYQRDDENGSIIKVLDKTVYEQYSYFFQKFTKKVDFINANFKDSQAALKILLSLSQGYLRKSELLSLGFCQSKELNIRLQKLSDLNYIDNLGDIYKIRDSLFSFWLKNIFPICFTQATSDPKQRNFIFRNNLEEQLVLFKEEFIEDKLKKVLQLFSAFQNDTIRLGKNKYRLPLVDKTKMISYPKRNFHLLIAEGKEIIFTGIKEKNFTDNDIFYFLEKGANIKGKNVKKIFISLDVISATAKVIAKNKKIILWDINDINRLLNIYNKPFVSLTTTDYKKVDDARVDVTNRQIPSNNLISDENTGNKRHSYS